MTDTQETLPGKSELERQQLYLANEKLKLEARKMEREVEPDKWWSKLAKNAVALGGVATVVVTIYGVWDSYDKTIKDREHTRVAEARVRFEDAIKRLESASTISKLVGVSVLSGYLDKSNADLHRQILFTLRRSHGYRKRPTNTGGRHRSDDGNFERRSDQTRGLGLFSGHAGLTKPGAHGERQFVAQAGIQPRFDREAGGANPWQVDFDQYP
jgi:hypothetical protein